MEWWQGSLPREGYPACELMMFNLSDKLVISCEVTLLLLDEQGQESDRVLYRAHDLEGRPRSGFSMTVPVAEEARPAQVDVIIEKVWFDDNDIWRRGKSPLSDYTSNALPNGRSLELLRFVAGSNAVGFPEEQGPLWVCVCGRPNPAYQHTCVRCQRERDQVFAQYNKEAIEKIAAQRDQQLSLKAKAAREDASRMQLEREQLHEQQQKKRRRTLRLAAVCVLGAAAVYAGVFHGLPYLRYRQAISDYENKAYAQAQEAFAQMGSYAQAETYVLECRYELARQELAAGDADSLNRAAEAFRALKDFKDSAAQAQAADYQRGRLLLDAGDAAGARSIFTALGDYADCAGQLKACDLLAAKQLLEQGEYAAAQAAFDALGDYGDAAALSTESLYRQGEAAVAQQDWDTALTVLAQTGDYLDTAALLRQAHYGKGTVLEAAAAYTEAGEHYLAAGDYQDAATRATACIYAPAHEAMEQGSFAKAAELFGKIPEYEDSRELYVSCTYQAARAAIKDKEYNRALGFLNQIPESYEDVFDLKMECIYQPGLAALAKEDYTEAVRLFTQITTYKDSADQLKAAQYGQGKALTESGDYDGAIALFTQLGSYKKSSDELRKAQYFKAGALLAAKDWQGAAALYETLGDYSDSRARRSAALYGQAEGMLTAGDRDGAGDLFASLGDYSDAAERAAACRYDKAKELAQAGNNQEAAELYSSLGDYSDARAQAQALYYALGAEAVNNGQVLVAGRMFALAGDYQDAAKKSREYFDAYYQKPAEEADTAMAQGEYALVVTLLGNMELNDLPETYAGLKDMYQEANYLLGNQLYGEGRTYEALPYYRAIPDYKDVESRLSRNCYAILGLWETEDGTAFEFREDGTCTLNGETLYFRVDNYTMETGAAADALSSTHKVSSLKGDSLTLRDLRGNAIVTYRLSRVTELPLTPAEELETPADYTVNEE